MKLLMPILNSKTATAASLDMIAPAQVDDSTEAVIDLQATTTCPSWMVNKTCRSGTLILTQAAIRSLARSNTSEHGMKTRGTAGVP